MIWRILAAVFIVHEIFSDRYGIRSLPPIHFDLSKENLRIFPGIGIQCERKKLLMTTRSGLVPFAEIQSFSLVEGIRGFRHRYILIAKLCNGDELHLFNVHRHIYL